MYTNDEPFTYTSFPEGIVICNDDNFLKIHDNFDINNDLIDEIDCKIGFSTNNSEWYISSDNKLYKMGENNGFDIPEFIKDEKFNYNSILIF